MLAPQVRSCIGGWAQRVKELWLWVIKVTRAAIGEWGGEGGMRSGGGFRSSSQVWGSVLQRDYHGEDSSLLRTKPSVQWFNPGTSDKRWKEQDKNRRRGRERCKRWVFSIWGCVFGILIRGVQKRTRGKSTMHLVVPILAQSSLFHLLPPEPPCLWPPHIWPPRTECFF